MKAKFQVSEEILWRTDCEDLRSRNASFVLLPQKKEPTASFEFLILWKVAAKML